MNATCDFAAQSMFDRSSNLTRPKMFSLTDLVSFLPQVSCSGPPSEDQLPQEARNSFSFKRLIPESEHLTSFYYNLGTAQARFTNHVEELRNRVNEMTSKSEKTDEWLKKIDRKIMFSYIAVGALAASCYGKQALAKIKTLSAYLKTKIN